jgi:Ca2+-binding RTX toxin-like protein
MSTGVTVLGSQAQIVTLSYDSSSNAALATQLAGLITDGIRTLEIIPASDASGRLPPVPRGKTGEYTQLDSGTTILPRGYDAYVTTAPNAVAFGSGDANESILSGETTNLTFIAGDGSGTVVAGGGTNRLVIAASDRGAWSLNTGNGNDVILALGSGDDTIAAGAGRNAILLGTGSNLVMSVGDDTVTAGNSGGAATSGRGDEGGDHRGIRGGKDSGSDQSESKRQGMSPGAGADTIDATGAKSDVVFGGSGDLLFLGGSGGATIFGGSGSETYIGGAGGSQVVHGGSAGSNFLFAGDGAATLFGGGNGDNLFAFGDHDQTLIAGSGRETLSAAFSGGNDLLIAGSGNNSLVGGTGADTFVGGSGHDTVFATNPGASLFEFIKGQAGGTELVQDVFAATDVHIHLSGYGAGEAAHALTSQHAAGGGVTISLTDGTKVTFQNISHLNSSNFT